MLEKSCTPVGDAPRQLGCLVLRYLVKRLEFGDRFLCSDGDCVTVFVRRPGASYSYARTPSRKTLNSEQAHLHPARLIGLMKAFFRTRQAGILCAYRQIYWFTNGTSQNSTRCKRHELHNGMCYKTVHVTERYVTKRYTLLNLHFLQCTRNSTNPWISWASVLT
jgi:hypothetical protein